MHRHMHHIKPKSLGGGDHPSNLAQLCPGCHDALHNAAYRLANKKYSDNKVRDELMIIYKDKKIAQRCYRFSVYVRDAMISSSEEEKEDEDIMSASFTITWGLKKILAREAKANRISQDEYIRLVLLNVFKKKGLVKDVYAYNRSVKKLKSIK